MADKSCFIIMPITTPDQLFEVYGGDTEHFQNVLNGLFIPAVKEAGMNPIPPLIEGANVIHAAIIKNLMNADLVLCDMSSLNPNVFFEVGVRTALNKPVCLVKDEKTSKVPFDTNILNFHKYMSSPQWKVEEERTKLAKHLIKSLESSEESNTMWKYFGLSTSAQPAQGTDPTAMRLDLILMELYGMKNQMATLEDDAQEQRSAMARFRNLPVHMFSREAIGQALDGEGATVAGTYYNVGQRHQVDMSASPVTGRSAMAMPPRDYSASPVSGNSAMAMDPGGCSSETVDEDPMSDPSVSSSKDADK